MRLKHYLYAARAYCLVALVPAVVIAALVYGYEGRKPKTYSASATLFVQAPTSSQSPAATDPYSSNLLTPTYSQMITEPVVTQLVDYYMGNQAACYHAFGFGCPLVQPRPGATAPAKASGSSAVKHSHAGPPRKPWVGNAKYPAYSIAAHGLTTQQNPGSTSSLVILSVTDTSPARAAAAVNLVARTFIGKLSLLESSSFQTEAANLTTKITKDQTKINDITRWISKGGKPPGVVAGWKASLSANSSTLQTLYSLQSQLLLAEASANTNVKLYSPATAPSAPVGPHPLQAALLAFAVVLLLGIGGVRLYYYLDDSLHKPEEIEEIAGAPILGSVLRFPVAKSNGAKGQPLISAVQPRSPAAESYRLIRTNLLYADIDNPPRTLVITSAKPGEGKSTTAGNLARVFAEGGHATAVIDADLRRPTLHRIFGVSGRRGLTTMLVSDPPNGRDAQTTDLPNLQIIASGPLPPNPADLLGSQRMSTLLGKLGEGSDSYVLLDSPPILSVADAAALSTMADGVVLVVDLKQTKGRDLRRAREAIETVGGRLLGVVVNRLSEHGTSYYYYHSYGYQTTYEASPEPLPAPESVSDNGREAAIHAGEQAGVS